MLNNVNLYLLLLYYFIFIPIILQLIISGKAAKKPEGDFISLQPFVYVTKKLPPMIRTVHSGKPLKTYCLLKSLVIVCRVHRTDIAYLGIALQIFIDCNDLYPFDRFFCLKCTEAKEGIVGAGNYLCSE